jgi:hypothetical protein
MRKFELRSSKHYLFISIAAAVLAAVTLLAYLNSMNSRLAESGRLIRLVVAARDLQVGEVLDASSRTAISCPAPSPIPWRQPVTPSATPYTRANLCWRAPSSRSTVASLCKKPSIGISAPTPCPHPLYPSPLENYGRGVAWTFWRCPRKERCRYWRTSRSWVYRVAIPTPYQTSLARYPPIAANALYCTSPARKPAAWPRHRKKARWS